MEYVVLTTVSTVIGSIIGSFLGYRLSDFLFGTPDEWFDSTSRHYLFKHKKAPAGDLESHDEGSR